MSGIPEVVLKSTGPEIVYTTIKLKYFVNRIQTHEFRIRYQEDMGF
jgi:hypothetical protein